MPNVRVERTDDGFEATNDRGGRVAIGGPDAEGVFSPVELLLAALGGCELFSVEPLTSQRGHRMVRLATTVTADKIAANELGPITITYDVELPPGDAASTAKSDEVLRAVAARVYEQYCTVGNTLKRPMEVTQVIP
ncbi:OsmC family protein [Actinomadura flavalba]|uniref:OsmC family protein n=1 Tax=Actinomadura flavalba TaxID=1120938 RepID=UPI0003656C5D|nr:OsmC family protein [Actinomadura flavalba]